MRLFPKCQSTQSIFLHANLLFAVYTDEKTSDLCHVWGIKWDHLTSSVNDVSVSILFIPSSSTIHCVILKSKSDYEYNTVQPFCSHRAENNRPSPTEPQQTVRGCSKFKTRVLLSDGSHAGKTCFPHEGGPLFPFSPSLQLVLLPISSSWSKRLRLKAG